MTEYLITPEDTELIDNPENHLQMRKLIHRERHGGAVSMTWVDIDGAHLKLRSDNSDRVYYIIEGTATFYFPDAEVPVKARDTVWIPLGTEYWFDGRLEYLVINGPAYAEGDDIYAD